MKMTISLARTFAFDALLKIESQRAFSSALLAGLDTELSYVDRSLARELVLGSLRRQMYLDRVMDRVAKGKKLDIEIRIALRLGIYQLVFLDKIPDHAAINDSVNLTVRAKKTSAKGLVNAVLRNVSRGLPKLAYGDEVEQLAVETSHSRWLIEKWIRDLGFEKAAEIAASNNEIPKPAFRVIDHDDSEVGELVKISVASPLVDSAYIADAFSPLIVRLAEGGKIYIQDAASQKIAAMIDAPHGGRILDVCAAPGGKTGLIARRNRASMIVAGDLHAGRVNLLRDNLQRQGESGVRILQYDAVVGLPFADETFNAVLVDAPCSGTGTIRHNPEIRYFLKAEDFDLFAAKQLAMLENASKIVKPGGLLIYSTCSLEREENEEVTAGFLTRNSAFRSAGEVMMTWPHRQAADGFYAASFTKLA